MIHLVLNPEVRPDSSLISARNMWIYFPCKVKLLWLTIIDCTTSILFLIEKLTKLVSINTWNGGPRAVLYWKKSADETWGASVVLTSFGSSAFFFFGADRSLAFRRGSLALIIRFIVANFFVRFARGILIWKVNGDNCTLWTVKWKHMN